METEMRSRLSPMLLGTRPGCWWQAKNNRKPAEVACSTAGAEATDDAQFGVLLGHSRARPEI